jgi:hypothetical protein
VHIIIDRYMVGHELMPGQSKSDIDMLVCDIRHFLKERAPNRRNSYGDQKPLHPIMIEGFKPIETRDYEPPAGKPEQQAKPPEERARDASRPPR